MSTESPLQSDATSRLFRLAGMYFAFQAAAVAGWWALLMIRPGLRIHFQLDEGSEAGLLAFWLPDLVLVAGGSAAASAACLRARALATPALWLVAGGLGYATLYCLAGALLTDGGWLGVGLMAPALVLSGVFAVFLGLPHEHLFRQARAAPARRNLAKTLGQIVVFWSVLLFLVPSLIVRLQARVGPAPVASAALELAGSALFLACSVLGVWSGYVLAGEGGGTPLPLDSPRRLVVRGPYAFVRNPMAIAGLGQGMAVGVYTGSLFVAAYVVLGGLIWQYVARPLEEEDLLGHFGADYERYRRQVRCWIPRAAPFLPGPAVPGELVGAGDPAPAVALPRE